MKKSYTELSKLKSFEDRFNYLKLDGKVGVSTFGYDRYLNQIFYKSQKWKQARDKVIIRDNGCDLGIDGYQINDKIIIHHMNPISLEDIEKGSNVIYDPEYLICVSDNTHNAIHFGNDNILEKTIIERKPGDTKLW